MEQKPKKICLVSFFIHDAFFIPLSHIREIMAGINPDSRAIITISPELSGKIIFDSKNDDLITYKNPINPLVRMINFVVMNVKISGHILVGPGDIDTFLFFSETGLVLPMIMAKLRNKRIIWLLPSSMKKMTEHHYDFSRFLLIPLQSLSYKIADTLILYSPNLIKEWTLQKYSDKILIGHEHFVNTDTFTATISFANRPHTIGFIGRLSKEKGVLNFVQALPDILDARKDLHVFIGGKGPLEETITTFLAEKNLTGRVTLAGWITHEDLPGYLNNLKLIVLPSYTEGLPNIMLEAMICGTPVIASQVGAIPDIIEDGETGFILENNSPACLTENILRALGDPNLEKIASQAKKLVEKEFTFDNTVTQWKTIFDEKTNTEKQQPLRSRK